jgi:hypothetical protein
LPSPTAEPAAAAITPIFDPKLSRGELLMFAMDDVFEIEKLCKYTKIV